MNLANIRIVCLKKMIINYRLFNFLTCLYALIAFIKIYVPGKITPDRKKNGNRMSRLSFQSITGILKKKDNMNPISPK